MIGTRAGLILTLAAALSGSGYAFSGTGDDHGGNSSGKSNGGGQDDPAGKRDDHGQNSGNDDPADKRDDRGQNSGHDDSTTPGLIDDHGGQRGGNGQDDSNKSNSIPAGTRTDRLGIRLWATPAGVAVNAEGNVDVRLQGSRQRLKVRVEARVPDGTMLNVFANDLHAGVVTLRFGEGELELEMEDGKPLPGGLFPKDVTMIAVKDLNSTAVLLAQFGAIRTSSAPVNVGDDGRKRVELTPTAAAAAIGAHGDVDLRVEGSHQRIRLQVEADVQDGTAFRVLANGVDAGSVTIRFGVGEFEMESESAILPPGIASIAAITKVQVIAADGTELFAAAL